jgi:lipopolysaccharide export system permease protein
VSPDSEYVIHAHAVDHETRTAQTVFFQIRQDDKLRIIVADELYQPRRGLMDPVTLVFSRGYAYQLDRQGTRDMSLTYNRLTVRLAGPEARVTGYKSKTESTWALMRSDNPKDLAEYQWRLSTPLATILLAVLAVPLSRTPPRQGRYGRVLAAVLTYAVFHTLMAMAKNLVQEGIVGPVPGLWWPFGLFGLTIGWMILWPRGKFRLRRPTHVGH